MVAIIITTSSSVCYSTWPNHLSHAYLIFSLMFATSAIVLISSFPIFSINVAPYAMHIQICPYKLLVSFQRLRSSAARTHCGVVNCVHCLMLSVYCFRGLPRLRLPSTYPLLLFSLSGSRNLCVGVQSMTVCVCGRALLTLYFKFL